MSIGNAIEHCRWCAAPVLDKRCIYRWRGRIVAVPVCADCEAKRVPFGGSR